MRWYYENRTPPFDGGGDAPSREGPPSRGVFALCAGRGDSSRFWVQWDVRSRNTLATIEFAPYERDDVALRFAVAPLETWVIVRNPVLGAVAKAFLTVAAWVDGEKRSVRGLGVLLVDKAVADEFAKTRRPSRRQRKGGNVESMKNGIAG